VIIGVTVRPFWRRGKNGGPQLGESDVSSVPQALVSLYSGRR
jgi:hypothetical protein